jgi:hypothetical protein
MENPMSTKHPYFNRISVLGIPHIAILTALWSLPACSDDETAEQSGTSTGVLSNGASCGRDSDCSSGYCDRGSLQKDFDCFSGCAVACSPEDADCQVDCANQCYDSCSEFCADFCGGDSDCAAECATDCPIDGGGPVVPGPGPDPEPDDTEETPETPTGGGTSGICAAAPGGGSTTPDAGNNNSPDAGGSDTSTPDGPDPEIDWAGTWSVAVDYNAACDVAAGSIREGQQQFVVTATMSANGGSVAAAFDDYEMSGPGSATRLTLSGQFPIRDYDGDIASNVRADNSITIVLSTIDDLNMASGTISGQFRGQFGSECSIQDGGTVTFSR